MNAISKAADNYVGKKSVIEGSTQPNLSPDTTMRAITWQGKQSMKLEQVPKPLITHENDVIVKITACTICSGSDGHMYAGELPTMDKGLVIGHEGMGIVEQKGPGVKKFNVGDRVVIAFDIACGTCEHCLKKEFTGCEKTNDSKLADKVYGHGTAAIFGYSRLMGNINGSQAEYVRVPFADINCYKVPDGVPDEKALFLSDVLCTSLHATKLGEVSEGKTVCIWGLGPIGLCTARWCQIEGASRIVALDVVPDRLKLAKEKLGIEVIDRSSLSSKELTDKLLELEPKGFDACIECVGFRFPVGVTHTISRAVGLETDTPELIDECLTALKPFGVVSVISDYAGYANAFPVGKIMIKHATVRSGQCPCQKYFPYVMEKVQDGTFDPTFMITHRIKLEDIPMAYEKLHKKEDGFVKVFVKVGDS